MAARGGNGGGKGRVAVVGMSAVALLLTLSCAMTVLMMRKAATPVLRSATLPRSGRDLRLALGATNPWLSKAYNKCSSAMCMAPRKNLPCANNLTDLILRPPEEYGIVTKSGMLPAQNWRREYGIQRKEQWDRWFENTMSLKRQYNTPLPIFRQCRLYYVEEYKLLFIRSKKTGGTTISDFLEKTCKDIGCTVQWGNYLNKLIGSTDEEYRSFWKNITVFSTTRNPYSRAASIYRFLKSYRNLQYHQKLKNKGNYIEAPEGCEFPSFSSFCRDITLPGFQDVNQHCLLRHLESSFLHIRDMYPCLIAEDGGWAVDYLVRTEHLGEDMKELMRIINAKKANSLPEFEGEIPWRMNANSTEEYVEWYKNDKECIHHISQQYAEDVELFRFPNCFQ